jgi:hypothetical protein
MRYALALVVVIVAGVGAKVFFFPSVAEATITPSFALDPSKMHVGVSMPAQEAKDMSFVYAE